MTDSRPLHNEPSPLEVKVLTRLFGVPQSQSIDTYLAHDGYKALEKALQMTPEQIAEGKRLGAQRSRKEAETR